MHCKWQTNGQLLKQAPPSRWRDGGPIRRKKLPEITTLDLNGISSGNIFLSVAFQAGGRHMGSKIETWGAEAACTVLAVLAGAGVGIAATSPALAQNGASTTAPHDHPTYWTPERMRSAQPATPGVAGTQDRGSPVSGPSGPSGGLPGKGPEVQPDLPQQQ
jgi:hypothetical protein